MSEVAPIAVSPKDPAGSSVENGSVSSVSRDAEATMHRDERTASIPVALSMSDLADTPPDQPEQGHPSDSTALWLRFGDRLVVTLLASTCLVLMFVHWVRLTRWGKESIEITSRDQPREYYYSLDINSASWVEFAQLDGIGEKLARRIVADRDENGPFRNPQDIGRVRGITPRLLKTIQPFLQGGQEQARQEQTGQEQPPDGK